MSVNPQELANYAGTNVILHLIQDDGSILEVEASIAGASPAGVAYKVKGSREVNLAEPSQIEEISEAPDALKKVSQKKLGPIAPGQIRAHLVDRHGMSLSQANSKGDADLVVYHNSLDHSDLGHKHLTAAERVRDQEEKERKKAERAAKKTAQANESSSAA